MLLYECVWKKTNEMQYFIAFISSLFMQTCMTKYN